MGAHTALRHPELVSGSNSPPAQVQRRQAEPDGQVMPIRVFALDQIDLPRAVPVFELLLAGDGSSHVSEHFVPYEPMDFVSQSESLDLPLAVLPKAFPKVASDTYVERPVRLTRKDVDAWVSLNRHEAEHDAKWTLKQVQGDERGEVSRLKPRHAERVSASISRLGGGAHI